MKLFMPGGVKVPHRKNTENMPAVRLLPKGEVIIPMSQHIGAPAKPVVKPKDEVFVGTVIGEAVGYVSAPVHSSVSGTVKKIESFLLPSGRVTDAVVIEPDGKMTPDPNLKALETDGEFSLAKAARDGGLVGLGGAGFPTSVKLAQDALEKIDTLILNGAECEPYITTDTRTMLDESDNIKFGVELILDKGGIEKCIIGIEDNKKSAAEHLKKVFSDDPRVEISLLPAKYPQGGEKILIFNTTKRVVPEGKLPSDVGVLVMNVTTVAKFAEFVNTGMPLVEKCITVDGSAVPDAKNVIAPIGTSFSEILEFVGSDTENTGKVLAGGPMMGTAVFDLNFPVFKTTNAILALKKADSKNPKTSACIHCGRCVEACPMGLNPTLYAKAMSLSDTIDRAERLQAAKVNLCIECGCCSYVCPANRPLVENNKLGKAELRDFLERKIKKGESKNEK